ncbi:MAG TPA: hypothetical protein DCX89_05125 [Saprospirales bacterium]|nr:hypothetical protein [Saprospirales bacterium]HAY71252.1 hypothetical protein [Saprospirales bacterium]HRQ29033.1 response regulator transcription factor [Saprospiraceae bacterium]
MKRIIIVDNESSFRKGLRTILENIGNADYIEEASNGQEFLKMLLRKDFDLVFIDLKMPIMDGIEATKKARAIYPDLTIIAFSSYENEHYRNLMLEAGADEYLSKMNNNYDALSDIMNSSGKFAQRKYLSHI